MSGDLRTRVEALRNEWMVNPLGEFWREYVDSLSRVLDVDHDTPTLLIRVDADSLDGGYVSEAIGVPGASSQGEIPREAVESVLSLLDELRADADSPNNRALDVRPDPGMAADHAPADNDLVEQIALIVARFWDENDSPTDLARALIAAFPRLADFDEGVRDVSVIDKARESKMRDDRYRHRVETESTPLVESVCGKVWVPIFWGQAARCCHPCPDCYRASSRKPVAA